MSRTGGVSIRDNLVKKRIAFRLPSVYGIPKHTDCGLGVDNTPFFPKTTFWLLLLIMIRS